MNHNEALANFMAITDCGDEAKALGILEASDWKLEEAVNFHFASAAAGGGVAGSGGGSLPGPPSGFQDEDEVRPAMAPIRDRLVDLGMLGGPHLYGPYGLASSAATARQRAQPAVDVFGDFEKSQKGLAGNAALSSLFQAPTALMFQGPFEAARARASQEGKWLMLNVQNKSEFASHRLNRDTWSNAILQDVIKGMLVFYQTQLEDDEGSQLASNYRISDVPAICLIDPITGLKVFEKQGFVDAEQVIEDLVPFMDIGPKDPEAGRLALKNRQQASQQQQKKASPAPGKVLSEDEQMAMAIAASMEQGTSLAQPSISSKDDDGDDDEFDEAAVYAAIERENQHRALMEQQKVAELAKPPPEQVMQEAEARVPPEPPADDSAACRIAVRLPTGERAQRRFRKADTVQALLDLVVSKVREAAAGKKFEIVASFPGAQPLADAGATLEGAGVENAMLVVKWLN